MKVEIEVELKPFRVPDFAQIDSSQKLNQEGFTPMEYYPLSELTAEALESMCEEFTKSVFEKAGKSMPPKEG